LLRVITSTEKLKSARMHAANFRYAITRQLRRLEHYVAALNKRPDLSNPNPSHEARNFSIFMRLWGPMLIPRNKRRRWA
jgi:hypothetical protein